MYLILYTAYVCKCVFVFAVNVTVIDYIYLHSVQFKSFINLI